MIYKRRLVDLITLHLSRIAGDEMTEGEVQNLITAIRMFTFPYEESKEEAK